jgi:hypothetical protein
MMRAYRTNVLPDAAGSHGRRGPPGDVSLMHLSSRVP